MLEKKQKKDSMKLVFHGPGHHKNNEGIKLMCASKNIDLEFTEDDERVKRGDFDILIINYRFISPDSIPQHVKIIYGPQFSVFALGPLAGPLRQDLIGRCVFNTLSIWVKKVCEEFSDMIVPLEPFPFGVDIERCAPNNRLAKTIDCVFYYKHRDPELFKFIESILKEKHINYILIKYGSYKEEDYIAAQNKSKFMIVLDAHESQGFALEEAMARNIPLLVIDAKSMLDEYNLVESRFSFRHYENKKAMLATSVPYWSDNCGIKISSIDEFSNALDKMMLTWNTFEPRRFIEENLSPKRCMERILTYFNLYT